MSAFEVMAYTAEGARRPRTVRLPEDPFDGRVHEVVMHEAVKTFLANQRQGTASTKTRGLVSGGNQKPWKQKGTGRARQGSIRAPNWPGGGTAFGPLPRDYRLALPRKVRRLGRQSALNARAREQALSVIETLAFDEPKTKRMAELILRMGLGEHQVLVLTSENKPNVVRSARNLQKVDVMRYMDASTYDILHADAVVIEEPALGALEAGAEAPAQEAPPPSRKRVRAAERAETAEAAAAQPERKKPAAKQAAPAKQAEKPAAKQAAPARKAAKPAAKKAAPAKKAEKPAAKKPGKKKGK
ncbi:MAG: 50S ribosomal protein L4 [Gemmatimonadales bacterium]|nr:50S ribosomal protein L4 [Gemmatimonadales bacterium]